MQPIAKGFYLGGIFVCLGLSLALSIAGITAAQRGGDPEAAGGFVCAGLPLALLGTVILVVLIYRLWSAIQAGPARTTPGKAVGFMFIPIFNVYWIFQVYWGWACDYNRYADELGLPLPRVSEKLAMAICIAGLLSIIPVIGIVPGLVNLVLLMIFLNSACDAVNALVAAADDLLSPMDMNQDPSAISDEWD